MLKFKKTVLVAKMCSDNSRQVMASKILKLSFSLNCGLKCPIQLMMESD